MKDFPEIISHNKITRFEILYSRDETIYALAFTGNKLIHVFTKTSFGWVDVDEIPELEELD